jgi:tRNA nucleotidyltransferase (CCA-adding enzyme)
LNRWNRKRGQKNFRYSVIASNPEKFKHLETTTFQMDKNFIDCVNLRTETYADIGENDGKSKFGTPLIDAMKRDFTINSLFYNIHTGCIEDYTGRGVSDLNKGLYMYIYIRKDYNTKIKICIDILIRIFRSYYC